MPDLVLVAGMSCMHMPVLSRWEQHLQASWFQSMVTWLCCFWACSKGEYHGRQHVVGQRYSPHGDLEAERTDRKRPGTEYLGERSICCGLPPPIITH
jgi:hypothetical protein